MLLPEDSVTSQVETWLTESFVDFIYISGHLYEVEEPVSSHDPIVLIRHNGCVSPRHCTHPAVLGGDRSPCSDGARFKIDVIATASPLAQVAYDAEGRELCQCSRERIDEHLCVDGRTKSKPVVQTSR